jgi:hypothetical protein
MKTGRDLRGYHKIQRERRLQVRKDLQRGYLARDRVLCRELVRRRE